MANGGIPWGNIASIIAALLASQENQGGGAENQLIFPPTILPPDYPFQQAFWNQMAPQLLGMQIPSFEQSGGIFGGPSSPMQQMANTMMQQQMTSQPMFMGGVAGSLGNLSGQTYQPGSADAALERFLAPNFINPELTGPGMMANQPSPFSIGGGRGGGKAPPGGGGKAPPGGGAGGKPPPGGGPASGKGGKPQMGNKPEGGGVGGGLGGGFPSQSLFTPPGQGAHAASRSLGSSLSPAAAAAAGPMMMMAAAKQGGGNPKSDEKPTPGLGPGPVIDTPIPPLPEIIGPDPTWNPPPGAGPGEGAPPPVVIDPGVFGTGGPGGPLDVTTPDQTEEQKGWWGRFWKWFKKNWTISGSSGLLDALEAYKEDDPFPGPGEPTVGAAGANPPDEEEEEEEDEDKDGACPPGSIRIPGFGCLPLGTTGGDAGGGGGAQTSGQVGEGGWWVYPDVEQPTLPQFQFQFQPSTFGPENFTPWTNPSTQMPIAQPGQVPSWSGWY